MGSSAMMPQPRRKDPDGSHRGYRGGNNVAFLYCVEQIGERFVLYPPAGQFQQRLAFVIAAYVPDRAAYGFADQGTIRRFLFQRR